MVRDLELADDFGALYRLPIFLYGAGNYGKKALTILRELGIMPEAFCDSNLALKGCTVEGVVVKSLDELLDVAQEKEIIIIITTASKPHESIVSSLENNKVQCDRIYTFYGLLYAIYFNFEIYEKGNKLSAMRTIWMHNQSLKVDMVQAEIRWDKLLWRGQDTVPVIVYQPGKVGSNTVAHSLRQYGMDIFHTHGISYPSIKSGNPNMKQCLVECIKSLPKVKMITLVREPIAKDIGHFFQKIDFELPDVGWMVKGILEKNFQRSFLNYLSVVTPFDFTENHKKEEFRKRLICHIDAIGQESSAGAYWGWYDEELNKSFGIDILNEDFDAERGYSIIKHDNIELLILKLEKLNGLADVIGKFVGINDFKINSINKGEKKSYKYIYKQFQKEVILPREYVEFYYKNNIYTNHFYNEEERQCFYEKWESHIG